MYFLPLIWTVWPALLPPWVRTTRSACSVSTSIILPLPSSPHWAPTRIVLAIYSTKNPEYKFGGKVLSLCVQNLGRGRRGVNKRFKSAGGLGVRLKVGEAPW